MLHVDDAISKLLALEAKHGTLPGYKPALVEVMDYLNTVTMQMHAYKSYAAARKIILKSLPAS